MTRLAAVLAIFVLALSVLAAPTAARAFGPPSICHPFRIGTEPTLPWGDPRKLNDFDEALTLDELADRTAELLASSDDTIAHMETIRRACLYLNSKPKSWQSGTTSADRAKSLRVLEGRLGSALGDALAARKAGKPDDRREALAWFDIAYLRGALDQIGLDANTDFDGPLRKALALQPKDVGMLLGAALLHFRSDRQWSYLDSAIRLVEDGDEDLRWNIVTTAGHFHDIRDFERLAERARRETGAES